MLQEDASQYNIVLKESFPSNENLTISVSAHIAVLLVMS